MSPRILDARGVFFPYDADHKDLRKLYDKDGADVSTIRNYGAKFGKFVAVEPGITNVITQSDWANSLFGWNGTDGNQATTLLTDGWRRALKQNLSLANTQIYLGVNYTVSVGQRYTEQFLFRFNGARPTFQLDFYTGTSHLVTPTLTHLGKGVWHAMATYVVGSGETVIRAVNINSITWNSATYIDLFEPVFHLHTGAQAAITEAIRTSHVWGTRAAGRVKYPGWLLPRNEGTISAWIRPNFNWAGFSNLHGIVSSHTVYVSNHFLFDVLSTGQLSLRIFIGGAAVVSINYAPGTWDPGQLYHVACSWSSVEQVLYFNGARVAARSGDFTRWVEALWVSIGCIPTTDGGTGVDHVDGGIDDLAIFRRQLSDTQVKTIYA